MFQFILQYRERIPLVFVLLMATSWTYLYLAQHLPAVFAESRHETWMLLDIVLTIPLVCFLSIVDKKQAAIKSLIYISFMVLLGSVIIPHTEKVIWHYLESGRYLLLAAFVVAELLILYGVIVSIRSAFKRASDPEASIRNAVKVFGSGLTAQWMAFEIRMWIYACFSKKLNVENVKGDAHFFSGNKDGASSNHLGFIFIILLEAPLMHMFLHYVVSALVANIVTGLTILSIVLFVAEYKALKTRPCSADDSRLYLRYALFSEVIVPYSQIMSCDYHNNQVKRAKGIKRFNYYGNPNIRIEYQSQQGIQRVYLGLDNPGPFVEMVKRRLNQ